MVAFPEVLHQFGPFLAGVLFGTGWWMWIDAVVCSKETVPFLHYLPGIGATLSSVMVNSIRKEDVQDYSPFDDGEGCQSRFWLFLAYVFAFMSLAGAAAFLVMDNQPSSLISTWVGTAGVLQSMFILGSGLTYWLLRSPPDYSYY